MGACRQGSLNDRAIRLHGYLHRSRNCPKPRTLMPDYDAGFKIVAHHAGRQLAELAGLHCQRWEPISEEVQATERLADRVFRAVSGKERFVVYMEAYTRWQA